MVRKRKKVRRPRAGGHKPQARLSVEELQARGLSQLEARRYKEAVGAFKDLLRQERRPEWVESLAAAYAGRARELAGKDMLKEAIAIWRNRAEACNRPLTEPAYFELLFRTGQMELALRLIREQRELIEAQGQLPALRTLCAAQALAEHEGVLDAFVDDDPLVRDFPPAVAALEAYTQGEDAELERQLKAIPFRSPFRDLRQILKALSLLDQDPAGAERLLDRVESGSPFFALCSALRASRLPDGEFLRRYRDMGAVQRRFAAALKGWSPQQISLAQELIQLGERPPAEAVLRFLLRHKAELGGHWVSEIGMRFLVSHRRGMGLYVKAFGPLSPFHRYRIEALHLEQEGGPSHVIFNTWRDAYVALDPPQREADPQAALSAALVLRHAVAGWLRTQKAGDPCLGALEHSLQHDPDDLPTYRLLIRLYREGRRFRDARRLLDEALSRYPEDTGVLTEAVDTAIASNAFKKAARFARQALKLDPINTKVRNILVNAHLAHARKQIQQGKIPLARAELDEAETWARGEDVTGRIDLTRGVLELRDMELEAARGLFLSGCERTGGGLAGHLHLLLEAGRMGYDLGGFMKQTGLPKPPRKADREQVLGLVHALNELRDEDEDLVIGAAEFLGTPLHSAARLDYSLPETELICETWLRLAQPDLRTRYARAALKRWPGTPVFVFHRVDADHDRFVPLSSKDLRELETAHERAQEEGDMRSAHRIEALLAAGMASEVPDEAFNPFEAGGFPGGMPEGADMDQLIDLMMEVVGPAEVEALKRELGPEAMRALLEAMLGGELDPDELDDMLPQRLRPKPRRGGRKKARRPRPDSNSDQVDLF
jgi:tetratricopeptide (TPR) repeat protein